ncbi:MarR family transcriptional regulator [Vagococcus sp. BWB3-3]|uniref:MarR family transcriptional regulator n=1 Tax=Vagococcus allomyrinae TaxID=2794353 RepID=A0A940SY07_9ENTE|nr:MarR family transcriptional regulator [Vagococcus allomyrinae]MBP1043916.1 MarR family transcriptional regulator [Vagococcus allomyrinae]
MENNNQMVLLGTIFQQLRELERTPQQISGVGKISPSEFHVIEQIGLAGKITSKELSQQLMITKGAISQLLTKLSKQGVIEREESQADKRVYYLHLTTLGEQVFQKHHVIHQQFMEGLDHRLSPSEQVVFSKGLAVLSQILACQLEEAEGTRNEG